MKKSFALILFAGLLFSAFLEPVAAATRIVAPHFTPKNAGTYVGLFAPATNADVSNCGMLSLTVNSTGMCSGTICARGETYPLWPTRLDDSGRAQLLPYPANIAPFVIDVQMDFSGSHTVSGTVTAGDAVASVVCIRTMFTAKKVAMRGNYNLTLSDGTSSPLEPFGKGFLAVTILPTGGVCLNGVLSDNTPINAQPTCINDHGVWNLYAATAAINSQGQRVTTILMGVLTFDTNANPITVSGALRYMCDDPTNGFNEIVQASGATFSVDHPPASWPSRDKVHIYLLLGQSNMAGHGQISTEDTMPHARVISFGCKTNFWQPAIDPLETRHGVGPGLTFAKEMAEKDPTIVVALIPAAADSTTLAKWERGTSLYNAAFARAQFAMKWGTFKGFLWHQGENDALKIQSAHDYESRLATVITNFRTDIGVPDAPFVVGEIGRFLYGQPIYTQAQPINRQLDDIPNVVPLTGCVSSEGLNANSDDVHFDGPSQHELGHRYADMMSALEAQAGK